MKNKKLMVVFILIIAFLLLMVTCTKASDTIEELPTINTSTGNNTHGNNQTSNRESKNNVTNVANNTTRNNTVTNNSVGNNNTLPQTGVQEDATVAIFVGICIISAIYAYFRIRKYKNID